MLYHRRWKGRLEPLISATVDKVKAKKDPGARSLWVSMLLNERVHYRRSLGQRLNVSGQTALDPCNTIRVVKPAGGCSVEQGYSLHQADGTIGGTLCRTNLLDGRTDTRAFCTILKSCGSAQLHSFLGTFDIRHCLRVERFLPELLAGKTRRVRRLDQRVRVWRGGE